MMERVRAYPMIVLLLPVVAAILLCYYTYWPVNLLRQTECDTLDSLYTYSAVLTSNAHPTKRCERYEARLLAYGDSVWHPSRGRVYLYVLRDSARTMPQCGDTIVARTRLRRPEPIGGFDYATYLRRQGIIGTAFVRRFTLQPASEHPVPLQARLYRRLAAAGLEGDELATTAALTLGYKEDLDPGLRQRFQASGAAHVLAVSGLHTGILYAVLLWLLTLGGRWRPFYEERWKRCLLSLSVIAVMWGYAWLTGMTPSVVRAVLMISLVEIGRMLYRQSLSLNTIAAAALLILLARPLDLWSVSFQLSFAATAAIVVFARDLERLLQRKEWRRTWPGRLLAFAVGIIVVSLAAQIGTLPITMYTFGQVSNYFLLTNLLVLPIATFLVPCGLLTVVLGGSLLGRIVGYAAFGLSWLMNHAVGWIESLPGSTSAVSINGWMVALLYAAIVSAWLAMHKSLWWIAPFLAAMAAFIVLFVA